MKKNKSKIMMTAILFTVLTAFLAVGETKYSRAEAETIQTTTTTTNEGNGGNLYKTVKVEKTETKEQPENKKEQHGSILGSFFGFLGNVIAFPFRLIGSALNAIF